MGLSRIEVKKEIMEKEHLFNKIRKVTAKIPKGKVTTYGAIAEFLGT